jgi:hypothetical protein
MDLLAGVFHLHQYWDQVFSPITLPRIPLAWRLPSYSTLGGVDAFVSYYTGVSGMLCFAEACRLLPTA